MLEADLNLCIHVYVIRVHFYTFESKPGLKTPQNKLNDARPKVITEVYSSPVFMKDQLLLRASKHVLFRKQDTRSTLTQSVTLDVAFVTIQL